MASALAVLMTFLLRGGKWLPLHVSMVLTLSNPWVSVVNWASLSKLRALDNLII